MKFGRFLTALVLVLALAAPAFSAEDMDDLKKQMQMLHEQNQKINEQLQQLQERLDKAEKASPAKLKEDVEELEDRVAKTERHTATDKLALSIELEPRVWSVHQNNVLVAPDSFLQGFFTPVNMGGFNGATLQQAQQGMAQMAQAGMIPDAEKVDVDNDIAYSTKFRLNIDGRVNRHLSFTGRLAAYKAWADSTGVKVNHGSMNDVYLDGNTSSLPHGDTLHVERAYFNYKDSIGSVPINFSLGRRPSTQGPPLHYRMNTLEAGSPHGSIINWQFDGASLNFGLEELTGLPGLAVKLCYGVGFEGQWGGYNTFTSTADVDDVHMAGVIATLYDDWQTKVELNYAHAWDVTDGFHGLTVMPFIAYKEDMNNDGTPEYYFEKNYGSYISRLEATENIGDWDAASLLLQTSLLDGALDLYGTLSWSHTRATAISKNPFYELMGMGLLSSNGELEDHDGYSVYLGGRYAIDSIGAKLGLEYNYGSKYWFNFTGAEDNLVASKLAARGHVFEPYWIQNLVGDNFFLKAGAQFFDYQYTGSGNPLGEPVSIDDVTAMEAIFPVIDDMQIYYLSAVFRY